jgi:flagellar biosynthetic protein FliR
MAPIFISTAEIVPFGVVLLRLTGIMIFAPFFSSQSIPVHVRIVFSLASTLVLAPALPVHFIPPGLDLSSLTAVLINEIMVGATFGIAASLVFAGLQFGGQLISFQLGFSLINLIDPQSEVEAPVFSFIHNSVGLLFFLLINGHHWFLLAISESFRSIPVGGIHLDAPLMAHIIRLSSQVLVIGVRIAGPIIAVTVIADIVMGVIGRAAPHINILIVGLPLKVLVGFSFLSVSFYFLPRLLDDLYSSLFKTLFSLIKAMV